MNYLSYIPIFSKLSSEEQALLTNSSFVREFKKDEIIHNGSNDCAGIILVISGQLRSFIISEDGREITLFRLFERDLCLFSASCMMSSIQFDITVTAEKTTKALIIPPETYKTLMESSVLLANYTNQVMASRFSDVMWLIDRIMWKSFDKRLADFLLNESTIENSLTLKITHEAIGNHLGSPREVVTRMLKYFVDEGLVTLSRGTVNIINKEGLEEIAE